MWRVPNRLYFETGKIIDPGYLLPCSSYTQRELISARKTSPKHNKKDVISFTLQRYMFRV